MTDFLGYNDDEQQRAALGPAFVAPEHRGPRELRTYHAMQQAAPEVARAILFTTDVDEATLEPLAVERWEVTRDPNSGETRDEGERWQKLMRWPTIPSIAEAEAAQANARLMMLSAWWPRLQAARALDDELGWTDDDGAQPQPPAR